MAKTKPVCRHCQNPDRKVNRPRGLCWNCYYTPGVRENYAGKYIRSTGNESAEELEQLIESRRATMPAR